MANPRVRAPVPQGMDGRTHPQPEGGCGPPLNFLAVVPSRSQDPLDWDVPIPAEKAWEERTAPGARRYRRRRFLWWLRWTVEATGETPGWTPDSGGVGQSPPSLVPHGAQGTPTGWSDGNVPDPWGYDGPIPGRRRAV